MRTAEESADLIFLYIKEAGIITEEQCDLLWDACSVRAIDIIEADHFDYIEEKKQELTERIESLLAEVNR